MAADDPIHPTMPMGGRAPAIKCGRLLRFPDEASRCPNDATNHIIWTPECENTIDCDEHTEEARRHEHVAIHPYEMACSMPGAMFVHDQNRCVIDETWLDANEAQEPAHAHA